MSQERSTAADCGSFGFSGFDTRRTDGRYVPPGPFALPRQVGIQYGMMLFARNTARAAPAVMDVQLCVDFAEAVLT